MIKSQLIKIGNSQGIRIPKALLQQTDIQDDISLEVKNRQIIISPIEKKPRKGWASAFKEMAENKDDVLLDGDLESAWDDEEWQW